MADEWEDESIVFVELCGVPSVQLFPPDVGNLQAEILGIASARPVMQINGHSFAGQYEDMLGTCLLMEKKNQDAQGSKGSESRKSSSQDCCVEYFCKTEKKLVMQPAVLVEKVVSPAEESYTEKATEPTEASSTLQTSVGTT